MPRESSDPSPQNPVRISRRTFLQRGALAAAGTLWETRYLWEGSGIHLQSGRGWVALFHYSREVFRLHERSFHGEARVWTENIGNSVAFGVRNARLPGTAWSGDICGELSQTSRGLCAMLRYEGLELEFNGLATDWLVGRGLSVLLNRPLHLIASDLVDFELRGGLVRLAPDGALHGTGWSVLRAGSRIVELETQHAEVSLVHTPAAAAGEMQRATTVLLHRGTSSWNLSLPRGRWSYPEEALLFDQAHVLAQENQPGERMYSAEFSRRKRRSPFAVQLDEPLTDTRGHSPLWTMRNPVYRVDSEDAANGVMTSELARPVRFQFGELALKLRNPSDSPALRASGEGRQADNRIQAHAALDGQIYEEIVLDTNHIEKWNVTVGQEKGAPLKPKTARLTRTSHGLALDGATQFRIVRPRDGLDVTMLITNVRVNPFGGGLHIRQDPLNQGPSLMVVNMGPQTLLEQGWPESSQTATTACDGIPLPPGTPVQFSKIASPSQVVVQLFGGDHIGPEVLSVDLLLQFWRYPLLVAPQGKTVSSAKDLAMVTDIVAPAGLSFSPETAQVMYAESVPRIDELSDRSFVSQIWHARLGTSVAYPKSGPKAGFSPFAVTQDSAPKIRPVLARAVGAKLNQQGWEYGLLDSQTLAIVADAGNATLQPTEETDHVVLSSAGAWLRTKARWKVDPSTSLTGFGVDIAQGEELLEETLYEAVLVPSGHRVSVIIVTRRQWCRRPDSGGFLVARLIRRARIKYHKKTEHYSDLRKDGKNPPSLLTPFKSITLIGDETPYLDEPLAEIFTANCSLDPASLCKTPPYWANIVNGTSTPYLFPVQCVDQQDNVFTTQMPMVLGCGNHAYDPVYAPCEITAYNSGNGGPADVALNFNKQRIAYAKSTKKGDTAYPTAELRLYAVLVSDLAAAQKAGTPPWYPTMSYAELSLDHVAAFGTGASNTPTQFTYANQYLNDPFDAAASMLRAKKGSNPAEVLLVTGARDGAQKLVTAAAIPLNFAGKLGGGLALPQSGVQALSRLQGAVFHTLNEITDVETFLTNVGNGLFNISDFVGDMGLAASLLGAVELEDILEDVQNSIAQAANIPILAARQLQNVTDAVQQAVVNEATSLLQAASGIQGDLTALKNTVTGYVTTFQNAVQAVASFVSVALYEQTAADVSRLEAVGGTVGNLAKNLQQQVLALSVAQRIAAATQPIHANTLPTLYQLRDYAANQLIGAAASVAAKQAALVAQTPPTARLAQQKIAQQAVTQATGTAQEAIAQLEQALESTAATTIEALNEAVSNAEAAFASILKLIIFQFAGDLDTLSNALAEDSSSPTRVADIITAVENIASDITSLPNAAQQMQSVIAALTTSVKGVYSSLNTQLTNTVSAFQAATKQYITNAIGSGAANVAAQMVSAAQGILTNAQLTTLQNNVNNAVATVLSTVNDVQTELTNLNNQFLQTQDAINKAVQNIMQALSVPQQISVTYDYSTPLKSAGPFLSQFKGAQSTFDLHSSVLVNLNGTPPSYSISAAVKNFQLLLLPSTPFVSIGFTQVTFTSVNGSTPVVNCPISASNVQLLGPLNFVADLAEHMGLPDYMRVQLTGLGVLVGINLPLPDIEVGAFDMMNLNLSAGVQLDFTGQPMQVSFGFANPSQHFVVTYFFLGGGGFIDLTFTPSAGLTNVDVAAALELGAMLALDFGVADGEVHAFAGFYLSQSPNDCVLSGYYRCGGSLEVLGLISVSVEFTMSLTYENRGGTAWLSGDCDLVIDVDILFVIDTSVSLDMHHDFCGTSAN
jgi:hypothetical protein